MQESLLITKEAIQGQSRPHSSQNQTEPKRKRKFFFLSLQWRSYSPSECCGSALWWQWFIRNAAFQWDLIRRSGTGFMEIFLMFRCQMPATGASRRCSIVFSRKSSPRTTSLKVGLRFFFFDCELPFCIGVRCDFPLKIDLLTMKNSIDRNFVWIVRQNIFEINAELYKFVILFGFFLVNRFFGTMICEEEMAAA